MKPAKIKKFTRIPLPLLVAIGLLTPCINAAATNKASNNYQALPFPDKLARYQIEIFRLINPSYSVDPQTKKNYYDPQFAKKFKGVVSSFSNLDKTLKKKLLSGPSSQGKYLAIGDANYIFYTACQAHWCNTTNIAILYQPEKQRMVGRLLYACDIYKVGSISDKEMQVIDQLSPIAIDTNDCAIAKEQK